MGQVLSLRPTSVTLRTTLTCPDYPGTAPSGPPAIAYPPSAIFYESRFRIGIALCSRVARSAGSRDIGITDNSRALGRFGAACDGEGPQLRDVDRHVHVARRVARWPDHRLRLARRHLYDADHWRIGHAGTRRNRLGDAAEVFA